MARLQRIEKEEKQARAWTCVLILIVAVLIVLKLAKSGLSQQAAGDFAAQQGTAPFALFHSLATHSLADSGTLEPY